MAKSKKSDNEFRVPDLSNATPEMLIDELGEVRDKIKVLKKYEGLYKDALLARLEEGEVTVEGEKYAGLVERVSQNRFQAASAKEEMGQEWYTSHCKDVEFTQVKATNQS